MIGQLGCGVNISYMSFTMKLTNDINYFEVC